MGTKILKCSKNYYLQTLMYFTHSGWRSVRKEVSNKAHWNNLVLVLMSMRWVFVWRILSSLHTLHNKSQVEEAFRKKVRYDKSESLLLNRPNCPIPPRYHPSAGQGQHSLSYFISDMLSTRRCFRRSFDRSEVYTCKLFSHRLFRTYMKL